MKKTIRIFISSPSDVEIERQVALQVIQRLSNKYSNVLEIKPVLWEREPLLASGHFQDALDPKIADIMVSMLWSRLGSPLPDSYRGLDGRTGLTGSEWEFENALKAFEETGKPELLVYRKTAKVSTDLEDINLAQIALEQKKQVESFFQKHFYNQDQNKTFKRAYFPFLASDEFEQLLENHLRPLIEKHLNQDAEDADITWFEGSPFLGLEAFSEKHHSIFFGRTKSTSEIIAQFQRQITNNKPFLMISGMSGCGKSSLINASLLPLIKTPRVANHNVGYIEAIKIGSKSLIDFQSPLLALCEQLVNSLGILTKLGIDADTLKEQILQSPKSLNSTFRQVCVQLASKHKLHEKVDAKLLLILDQSEEIFTTKSFTLSDQKEFWCGIKELVASDYMWCIGSIRSDFVCHGQETLLYELMQGDGDYKLQPPNSIELRQIIEEPAHAAGLQFELDNNNTSLADIILQDSQSQPGSLPLVEFCLDELYKLSNSNDSRPSVLSFNHYYNTLGGLSGAISQRAESITQDLQRTNIKVDSLLPRLFNALVQLNPNNINSAATAKTVPLKLFEKAPEILELIEAFVSARLIIVSDSNVRFAHETLLTSWNRVTQWLATDREFQTFKAQIERDLSAYKQEKRSKSRLLNEGKPLNDAQTWLAHRELDLNPEVVEYIRESINKSNKHRQKKLGAVALVLLSLSTLTVYSWMQQIKAITNQKLAIEQQQRAENLLEKVRDNVEFMDNDLRGVLTDYVPSSQRVNVIQKLDEISDVLFIDNQSQSIDDLRSKANVLSQKAELILVNDSLAPNEAHALYKQAFSIRQKLVQSNPNNIQFQLDLASAHMNMGFVQERLGQYEAGKTEFRHAYTVANQALKTSPNSFEIKKFIASNQQTLAISYSESNDFKSALEYAKQSIALSESLLVEYPNNQAVAKLLYKAYGVVGEIELRKGNALTSIMYLQKALSTTKALLVKDPKNLTLMDDLAYFYENLADAQQEGVNIEEALASLLLAVDLGQQLVALDPENRSYQQALSSSYYRLGNVYEQIDEFVESYNAYNQALQIDTKLVQLDPSSSQYKRDLAFAYTGVGVALLKQGKSQDALVLNDKAIKTIEPVLDVTSGSQTIKADLGSILINRADIFRETNEFDKSHQYYQQALQIYRDLLAEDPDNPKHLDDIALSLERQGLTFLDENKYQQAIDKFKEVSAILIRLSNDDPSSNFYPRNIAMSYHFTARGYHDKKAYQEALGYYQQALELRKKLAEHNQNSVMDWVGLSDAYLSYGDILVDINQIREALLAFHDAEKINLKLLKWQPGSLSRQHDLSQVYIYLHDHYDLSNQFEKAKDYGLKALKLLKGLKEHKDNHYSVQKDIDWLGQKYW